jgi:hypothetical protein
MKQAIEVNQHLNTAAKKEMYRLDIYRLIADVKADERVLRNRRLQLEALLADVPAVSSHDTPETALNGPTPCATLRTAQDPQPRKLAAAVACDLWRFSCEMPDAPHLRNI